LSAVCDDIDRILHPLAAPLPPPPAVVSVQELPKFVKKLPPALRSQGGLMLLAGVTAAAGIALIYLILTQAHLI
jgi:hypothetical protein